MAEIRTERVTLRLDRAQGEAVSTLVFRQRDRGARVLIALTRGGQAFDAAAYGVRLMCGVHGRLLEQELPIEAGAAVYTVGSDLTASPGRYRPYVEVRDGEKVIAASSCFEVAVEPAPDLSADQAEEESGRLSTAEKEWREAAEKMRAEFDGSQAERAGKFEESQAARETAFDEAEAQREGRFLDAQEEQQAAFDGAQTDRTEAFEAAQAERQSAFEESEAKRAEAEAARVQAESARVAAESARVQADLDREERQAKNDADQARNNDAYKKLEPVVLTEGQYDPDTLVPTIEGEPNRMYFVPVAPSTAAVALTGDQERAAEAGNLYAEWMLIAGAWEQMGISAVDMAEIATGDIDAAVSDGSPSGPQYLSLTGLSYLAAKLKGMFAALSHRHAVADVDGLQGEIDGMKADIGGKQPAGSYAAASHTHPASQITDLSTWRLNNIFPVGCVYISWNSTSPASMFGGQWAAITGRFPYFNAGTGTGGSNSTTLTVAQMPSHSHGIYIRTSGNEAGGFGLTQSNSFQNRVILACNPGEAGQYTSGGAGSNNAFSSMPSYQSLYAWRRTA